MKLISVNIGQERSLQSDKRLETTGIFKIPSNQSVQVTELGLVGDFICDVKNHGGPDQAVYVYGGADYAWWSAELGHEILPGTFGENLTISDLESAVFSVGDRLIIGPVTLEVTSPRIPCATLAARMSDPKFVKRFRQSERPGLYCRVIQTGSLQVGLDVSLQKYQGETVSVLEMFRDYYEKDKNELLLRRQLNAPVAIRARNDLEQDLQKLLQKESAPDNPNG
jgi:MOSC domain-containing protein YiiM